MDFNILSFYYDSVESTNETAKKLSKTEPFPFVVIANSQSKGKGTRGKSFHSPSNKGIYMSLCIEPLFSPSEVQSITLEVAHIISGALNHNYGLKTTVKFPNDILLDGKKLCGILTEASFNSKQLRYDSIIIGIGMNMIHDHDLPHDIKHIYTSLQSNLPAKDLNKDALIYLILNAILEYLTKKEQ